MKKRFFQFLIICTIAVLAACGGNETESGSEEQEALKEMDIMLDWYPNAVHSYLYVAEEKGYFAKEGLKVNIRFPANPTDPLTLAAAGKITLGFYYQPDVIMARANENVPVKAVGAIVRSPLNHVVLLDESPVQSPKDLEDKIVGYPGIPLNEALLKTMIEFDGGDFEKVNFVDVGFELGSSIVSKQADAVIGAYINHEVPVLRHKGYETRYFNPTDYGVPSYYELVAVTNDDTWEKDEESIRAFWRAAEKGYADMKNNPEEALDILLSNQDEANFPLEKEVEKESLEILLGKMESDNGFGSQDAASWQEVTDWLKSGGLIKNAPAVEDMYVNLAD